MRFAIQLLVLLLSLFIPTVYGAEPVCSAFEQYFAPDDDARDVPLAKPHPDFVRMRQLAGRGDANQQFNIAVAYNRGQMVTPCWVKAEYWFLLSAANGNSNAQDWVAQWGDSSCKSTVIQTVEPSRSAKGKSDAFGYVPTAGEKLNLILGIRDNSDGSSDLPTAQEKVNRILGIRSPGDNHTSQKYLNVMARRNSGSRGGGNDARTAITLNEHCEGFGAITGAPRGSVPQTFPYEISSDTAAALGVQAAGGLTGIFALAYAIHEEKVDMWNKNKLIDLVKSGATTSP